MSSAIITRQAGIVDVDAGRHVSIGARSKIQSHSFICEYVTLGEACFVGHGVTFANDLFKDGAPNADPASWGAPASAIGCPSVPAPRSWRWRSAATR